MEMPNSTIEILSENHKEVKDLYDFGVQEKALISLTFMTKVQAIDLVEKITNDSLLLNFHEVSEEKA